MRLAKEIAESMSWPVACCLPLIKVKKEVLRP
jgi:hypothetical protein